MKDIIILPPVLTKILAITFIALPICLVIYFGINWIKYLHELDTIQKIEIEGLVTKIVDVERGFYHLEIKNSATDSLFSHDLNGGNSFFTNNHIQVNDSVSKSANSREMIFYKKKNGKYEECGMYLIESN